MTRRDYRALPALIFVSAMLLVLMAQPAQAQRLQIYAGDFQNALGCLTF